MSIYMKNSPDYKKILLIILQSSLAIVIAVIESQFPVSFGIQGFELGLANIITVSSLVYFSFPQTLFIIYIRCIIASLFMNGPVQFIFSITGALLSAIVMWVILKYARKTFSYVGISIAGSIAHNIAQIFVACFLMSDLSVVAYMSVMLLSGILTGSFVGICSYFQVKVLKKLNLMEYL